MAETLNHVFEGVDYDTSLQYIRNKRLRDGHNIRLVGTTGEDFIAEALPGNVRDINNGLGFDLRTDAATGTKFREVAHASVKGFCFVASWNPIIGVGEIGCFPSINPVTRTFQRVYLPLQNYVVGQVPHKLTFDLENGTIIQAQLDAFRINLSTANLQFQLTKATEMEVREDYDGSVNIYLCDGTNPDRVFNSGFNVNTGAYNNRLYNIDSFDQVIRLYNETLKPPVVALNSINEKGKLKCGNVFLHFRYADESFNKTSFSTVLGPIPVALSSFIEPFACRGGLPSDVSNKSILIDISTGFLDQSYKFVEIAIARYTNDQTAEVTIIDKQWNIQEMIAAGATYQIEVTGYESFRISTPSELIARKRTDEVCETMTSFESRLYRGNTSEDNIEYNQLLAFSKTIVLTHITKTMGIKHAGTGDGTGFLMSEVGYKNPKEVLLRVGYFGMETYPFGVVFLLRSGKLTPAFPIEGFDNITTDVTKQVNKLGLYRFPKVNCYGTEHVASIMGVKATVDPTLASAWVRQNVIGMYFVRGERIKNLQYQGLQIYSFDSRTLAGQGRFYNDTGGPAYETWSDRRSDNPTSKRSPFLDYELTTYDSYGNQPGFPSGTIFSGIVAKIPWLWNMLRSEPHQDKGLQADPVRSPAANRFVARKVDGMYGLFAPDYAFSKRLHDRSYNIEQIGTALMTLELFDNDLSLQVYFKDHKVTNLIPNVVLKADAYGLLQWQAPDKGGFTSFWTEGSGSTYDAEDGNGESGESFDVDRSDDGSGKRDDFSFFYHYSRQKSGLNKKTELKNLAMGLPPYIGLDYSIMGTASIPLPLSFFIMNVFSSNPYLITDISTGYNFSSNRFFRISDFISMPAAPTSYNCWKGDCFVSRTYLKTLGNPQYDVDLREDDTAGTHGGGNNYLTFGMVAGMVLEQSYNNDYRCNPSYSPTENSEPIKDMVQAFWPAAKPNDVKQFAVKTRSKESLAFNTGYNRTVDEQSFAGFDVVLPLQRFRFPLRITTSNKYVQGSFIDTFRICGLADHKDFDERLGEITALRKTTRNLYSVHYTGVIRHIVEQKAIQTSDAGQKLEIAADVEVLDPKGDVLTDDFGSQHKTSVIGTDQAIYAVDWNKRKIWIADTKFSLMSDTLKITSKIQNFIDTISPSAHFSDAADNFIEQGQVPSIRGIATGFNRKFKEVIFAFLTGENRMAIVYNEKAGYFCGTRTECSPCYILINEDFFSCNPNLPENFSHHDRETAFGLDNYLKFYGSQIPADAYWEFVVNIQPDDDKLFQNIFINSNDQPFKKIIYATEFQGATHDPFILNPEEYIEPVYKEGFWRLAIKRADVITGSHYALDPIASGIGTELREKYLRVKVFYNGAKRQYIKSLRTFFVESKI